VIQALQELTSTNRKGVDALHEAENALAEAEHRLDTKQAYSFLSAGGSVAERNAQATLDTSEQKLERDLAKASVNRIRMKLRVIESEIMANATIAKLLQAEMRL
jgi:Tfp pilus assembly protein PilX